MVYGLLPYVYSWVIFTFLNFFHYTVLYHGNLKFDTFFFIVWILCPNLYPKSDIMDISTPEVVATICIDITNSVFLFLNVRLFMQNIMQINWLGTAHKILYKKWDMGLVRGMYSYMYKMLVETRKFQFSSNFVVVCKSEDVIHSNNHL